MSSSEYKTAFAAYVRYGVPIDLSLKQARPTTHYIWRTRKDERVRPSHATNAGKIFAWANSPPTGHPGEDYGCRCTAEPYAPENINHQMEENARSNDPTPSEWVNPSDGLFGTLWKFNAGRKVRIEAQSTNVIGTIGFRVYYNVYPLNKYGRVIPMWETSDDQYEGSHVLPMGTEHIDLSADFEAPYGYYWIMRAESARTTDNESYIFYRVYR
jgi:hypothetical protein